MRWAAAWSYAISDAFARSGHWASHVLIGSIIGAIALHVHPISPANPLALDVPLLLMLLVVVSWLRLRAHNRGLCERCMTAIPLNPSESAVRYRRRLATAHLASRKPLVIGYLAILVGSAFLPGTVGLWIWAGIQATMIYLILSSTTHRRIQPWCPSCRSEGGGDNDRVNPEPDPVPYGSDAH